MHVPDEPPVVSVIGRKNSGKTTLVVALAAALKRRGYRVASMKHGHHDFEVDQPGRDSWRHFHEGGVEAVMMVAAGKLALVRRTADAEPDPQRLVQRYFAGEGYDLVLVEGFKQGPFPKIEIFRQALHAAPIHLVDASSAGVIAFVTDDASLAAEVPVLRLPPNADFAGSAALDTLIEVLERRVLRAAGAGGG